MGLSLVYYRGIVEDRWLCQRLQRVHSTPSWRKFCGENIRDGQTELGWNRWLRLGGLVETAMPLKVLD